MKKHCWHGPENRLFEQVCCYCGSDRFVKQRPTGHGEFAPLVRSENKTKCEGPRP